MKDLLLKMEAERNQFYAEENARLMAAVNREESFASLFNNSVTGNDVESVCDENDLHYYNGFALYTLACVRGQFTDKFGTERDHLFILYRNGKEVERAYRLRSLTEMDASFYEWRY